MLIREQDETRYDKIKESDVETAKSGTMTSSAWKMILPGKGRIPMASLRLRPEHLHRSTQRYHAFRQGLDEASAPAS